MDEQNQTNEAPLEDIQEAMEAPGQEQAGDTAAAELRLLSNGVPSGDTFPLPGGRAVIGRFDQAVGPVDIDLGPFKEGVYVSRKHAVIRFEDGRWLLKDLNSSNGTFVLGADGNFERLSEEQELKDGQEIALGNARFTFHLRGSNAPAQSEPPAENASITEDEATTGLG